MAHLDGISRNNRLSRITNGVSISRTVLRASSIIHKTAASRENCIKPLETARFTLDGVFYHAFFAASRPSAIFIAFLRQIAPELMIIESAPCLRPCSFTEKSIERVVQSRPNEKTDPRRYRPLWPEIIFAVVF